MERVATEVETELLDLSGATLEDLDRDEGTTAVALRLICAVRNPATSASSSDATQQSCVS
ncbi:hypothetical protein [Streptomyces botrytidirepellens]|uniref:Uncharacterized protein n=1 Tax=Streptomyces botrytidirepellens TaxID=2486417 RepID=A0A3M8XC44_9ACTN|nr:hypothetical protein [Streptomyces botrytidirepellens]RNG39129.1 hypothetical protein EEJ42_00435 [Streptomyces botrytidirepellens]